MPETAVLTIRRLILPLTLAVFAVYAGASDAQTTFPAPLPGQAAPSAGAGPFGPAPPECMKGFMPLREDAENKGKLIKAASERHALPDEACKLIGAYSQAEVKMIKYVESHAASCGIPPQIADQLKNGHKGTEALEHKVCSVAQQMQQRGPGAPLRRCGPGEYWSDTCVFEIAK